MTVTAVATLPRLDLRVDGSPAGATLGPALTGVRVAQRLGLPAQCELTFADPPGPLGGAAAIAPGAALRVGPAGGGVPLFEGDVTAVESVYGPDRTREVRVRAYDRLHRLRTRQPAAAHEDVTAAGLATELAGAAGLSVQCEQSGPTWPLLLQHRQTDLELLHEVADRAGLWLTLRGEVVHLFTPAGIGEPVALALGAGLLEAAVERNATTAAGRVEAEGWDPLLVEPHRATATDRRGSARVGAGLEPDAVRRLPNLAVADDEQAGAAAQAELDRRSAGEVVLRGVADGDPRLRPGTPVDVTGLDRAVCGRYVLTAVDHVVGPGTGYVTRLSTEPPEPPARPPTTHDTATMTVGVVEGVGDPDGIGRVRVRLPALGDLTSAWMQVLAAGAGPGKGLVTVPDPGDLVLVLLPGGDPARGVVAGALFGAGGPADAGVDGGEVVRWTLQTAAGHRLTLDDAGRTIRLEDPTGSSLVLAPDGVRLHAAVDLVVEAPGRRIAIRADAVDFERA